jgi:peptidoglycan/LPS O-acetylase OafA/YrhL
MDAMHLEREQWRLGHRPALDGIRAVAIGLVLVTHCSVPGSAQLGNAGVTMFFTLSGFLITSLLLEERGRGGRYAVLAFYRRRALRLVPALVVCVAAAVIIEMMVRGRVDNWVMVLGALTYTSNFMMMDGDWGSSLLAHTWSLAIEEQFYLLWPLTLAVFLKMTRSVAVVAMVAVALGASLWRTHVYEPGIGHAYLGLDTRADALLLGCALAFGLSRSRDRRAFAPLALLSLAGVVLVARFSPSLVVALLTPPLMVGVLYVATHSRPRMLSAPPLVWLGRRAYGLYLYHALVLFVVRTAAPEMPWWMLLPLVTTVSVVVAAASFRWIEAPFLARRHAPDPRRADVWRPEPAQHHDSFVRRPGETEFHVLPGA